MSRFVLTAALVAAAAAPAAAQVTSSSNGEVSPAAAAPAAAPVLREPVAEMFTDAKIAGVASVSNMSEIVPSQLALSKAQHPDVRRYAQRMIDEHTKLEATMQAMLRQKGVTPEHNGYSYQVQQNLAPMLRQLNALSGRDFDRLYMDHQVGSHLMTLSGLDTSLIPQAKDPQMKAMLQQQVRPAVAMHLTEAQGLRDAVARGGAPAGR